MRWIRNPADDPPERSAGLLRVFLLGELPEDQARAHLPAVADHSHAEIERLKQLEASIPCIEDDTYGHAALEYGLRFNAMQEEWANWLARRLDERT